MSRGKDGGFLDRWSARKRGIETEEMPENPDTEHPDAPDQAEAPVDARSDADYLAEAGLADPDDLPADGDFTAYIKANLPERIKQRALRRLWRSNPVLANLDGLCDYDDDFTDAATVIPGMKTLYQVGKGMFQETAEDEIAEDGVESPENSDAGALAEKDPETAPDPLDDDQPETASAGDALPDTAEDVAENVNVSNGLADHHRGQVRGHMRFRYQSRS